MEAQPSNDNARISKPANEQKHKSAHNTGPLEWIIEQLTILAEAFGERLTDARLRLNAEDLCDIPIVQLQTAFRNARRDLTWFPKVAELRKLAGASAESAEDAEARSAWDFTVSFAARWVQSNVHGYYAPDAGCRSAPLPVVSQRIADTVRRIGGWRAVKCMAATDVPFVRQRFFEEYRVWIAVSAVPAERFALPGEVQKKLVGDARGSSPQRAAKSGVEAKAAAIIRRVPEPLTDAQLADRRRLLKQQAEALLRQRG